MIFEVLSAIALGIGITATAHDLTSENPAAGQNEPVDQIQEVGQSIIGSRTINHRTGQASKPVIRNCAVQR